MSTSGGDLRKSTPRNSAGQAFKILLVILITGWLMAGPVLQVFAQISDPVLTMEPLTWGVTGVDVDDFFSGPTSHWIGVRVKNTGNGPAPVLTATFAWLNPNLSVTLQSPPTQEATNLKPGQVVDFFYKVEFNQAVISQLPLTLRYNISIQSASTPPVSIGEDFSLVITGLVEEDPDLAFLPSMSIDGPTEPVTVGDTVRFNVNSGVITSTQTITGGQVISFGYNVLAHEIVFPTSIFRLVSANTTYTTLPGSNYRLYRDACLWDDFTNGCQNPGEVFTGTASTEYTLEVIGTGIAELQNVVYGLRQGEYVYLPTSEVFEVTAVQPPETNTPTATGTGTQTTTATATATATATGTGTPPSPTSTVTGTPPSATATSTATGTGTPPTATSTGTATVTGTPPTATATRTPTITGTPPTATSTPTRTSTAGATNMTITNAVSPAEARVGANMTFTIRVTNSGGQAATAVRVDSTYSTYLDITSVTTTRGTYTTNSTTRTITVNIGNMNVNDSATITVVTRVNSTLRATTSVTNVATLTYTLGTQSPRTQQSNTVSYRMVVGSTLPGTGFFEPEQPPAGPPPTAPRSGLFWPALLVTLLLALLGGASIIFGVLSRQSRPVWAGWYIKTGLILAASAVFFGLFAAGMSGGFRPGGQGLALLSGTKPVPFDDPAVSVWEPASPSDGEYVFEPTATEPAVLPDFPIPTPPPQPTAVPGEPEPDTSEVVQLEIPSLGIYNQVKYVPFDGTTWMIAGMREEIAWMGESSWPGLGGNTALAGHVTLRDGAEGPFRYLSDLKAGDTIRISTLKNEYTYRVRQLTTVADGDLTPIQDTTDPQLTLITCNGWDADLKLYLTRLIVISDLVKVVPLRETALQGN